jgi:hypothetical protein
LSSHSNIFSKSPPSMFPFSSPSSKKPPSTKDGRPSLNSSNKKLVVCFKAWVSVILLSTSIIEGFSRWNVCAWVERCRWEKVCEELNFYLPYRRAWSFLKRSQPCTPFCKRRCNLYTQKSVLDKHHKQSLKRECFVCI